MTADNQWLIENTGHTALDVGPGLMDLLNGSYTGDIIEHVEKLQDIFGANFEKLYKLHSDYEGKAYASEVKNGNCRCGSCSDIYELHICIKR